MVQSFKSSQQSCTSSSSKCTSLSILRNQKLFRSINWIETSSSISIMQTPRTLPQIWMNTNLIKNFKTCRPKSSYCKWNNRRQTPSYPRSKRKTTMNICTIWMSGWWARLEFCVCHRWVITRWWKAGTWTCQCSKFKIRKRYRISTAASEATKLSMST